MNALKITSLSLAFLCRQTWIMKTSDSLGVRSFACWTCQGRGRRLLKARSYTWNLSDGPNTPPQNKTKQNKTIYLRKDLWEQKKKKRNPISVLIKIPFAVRPRRLIFLYRWVRWPGRTFAVLYFWDCINSKRMQTLKEQCVPGKQCVWRALPFTMSAARKPTWQTNFVPPAHRNRNWSA